MNIFNHSYKWWQIGILKLSVILVGIAIGANWPEIFLQHTIVLLAVAVILAIYLTHSWFKNKE